MTSIDKRSNELIHLSLWGLLKIRTDLKDYLDYLSTYVNAMLGGLKIKIGEVDKGIEIIKDMTDTRIGYGLPRLHYNLACSYSIWAAIESGDTKQHLLDLSLEALRTSFWLSEDIASRARENDLSLECVSHERAREFKQIIAVLPTPPQQTSHYELEDVNSLNKANVRSLEELQLSDPITLRLSLIDWAKTTKAKTVPSDSVVQLWVSEALTTTPFIQV